MVDGSWDAHLASPAYFLAGADRDWPGHVQVTSNALSNLRLLLVLK